MATLDSREAHRHAGITTNFKWQDDAEEGYSDGVGQVDTTTIIGTLPEEVHGAPVYVIHVDGTAVSTFGYSYQMEETITVRLTLKDDDEYVPISAPATDEEIAQAKQHVRDEACKEYGELMSSQTADAERVKELRDGALAVGLHFAQDGEKYILEPATAEEIDAYEKAIEEEEGDE
jgi:hypothetical protein